MQYRPYKLPIEVVIHIIFYVFNVRSSVGNKRCLSCKVVATRLLSLYKYVCIPTGCMFEMKFAHS